MEWYPTWVRDFFTLLTTILRRAPIPLTKGAISRPLAAESCLAVKEDRCFISDLTTDVKKREDFSRVTILVGAIAAPKQRTQEHTFARVTVMKCDTGVVEDIAVDQAADFHGERGEVWGHVSSAVWTIRAQSSTTYTYLGGYHPIYMLSGFSTEVFESWRSW